MVVEAVRKSATLIEALPYIKAFSGKFIVIKLGGSAQGDPEILRRIFLDIDFMLSVGMKPIVVYGGGKYISEAMSATGKEPCFIQGQRVTDPESMEIVANVLIDKVGASLKQLLEECGGRGELLNGRDQRFLRAIKKVLPDSPDEDLGCVGEPVAIDAELIHAVQRRGAIPLVAPVACGVGAESKKLYNINGDNASALIARDLHAEKLVFMSDIPGIFRDPEKPESMFKHLDEKEINQLLEEKVIQGGMIPKVEASMHGLDGGVRKIHIVSGEQPHALLLEIFTAEGVGTEIVR